jgi:protein-S-isoprenylcysteine O-methyltransferase Ste14
MPESNNNQAQMAAVKQLIVTYVMLSIHVIVFFIAAGHIAVRQWIFFGFSFLHSSLSIIVQYKLNPELLAVRLKVKREGSKLWDEILMRVTNLTALIAVPAVAGLDIGRFYWSNLDWSWLVVGLLLLVVSTLLLNWAMIVNPNFEPTVRIQKDRGHKVITNGPYRIIRHPGYLAGILYILSVPLIMGSILTFIPVGMFSFFKLRGDILLVNLSSSPTPRTNSTLLGKKR